MITRVLLRNWRGYEKLSLDLGDGLTFVIADNGVGKTSLVDGVSWAIFGDASGVDADAAIRAGTSGTVAEVDLVVGGTTLSVSRSLQRGGRDRRNLAVEVDGAAVDPADLPRRLGEASAVPPEILPQLMFVPEMRLTHEGELFADVQDHLAALLGIDSLRNAAKTAREVGAATAKQIRAARQVARQDEAVVEAARRRVSELAAEIERIDSSIRQDAERRDELDATLRQLHEWDRYDEQLAEHQRRLDELAEEARAVGVDPDPDDVADAEQDMARQSEQVSAVVGETAAERGLVMGFIDQLGSAEAVCPVCLRAMDDDIARHAADAHRSRLDEIERRRAAAERRQREVTAQAEKVRTIASALARLRPPRPPDTARPEIATADAVAQRDELDDEMMRQIRTKGALEEQQRRAQATVDEADDSQAVLAEVSQLHAVAAAASALAQLAGAEADARTERSLDPLSRTLAARWAEFFAASSARPRLAGVGQIELDRGAAAVIPYSSFSGGEKTLASLLTRLLFVTAATELRTMWLDEPLEHLDPANRTRVARLLAQVTQPGSHMRQVVVTTYEEGLARRMSRRHDPANIVYVSTDELL